MGSFLMLIGIVSLILGIVFTITVFGATVGIPMIIDGIVLYALGKVYNDVRDIKVKMK